MDNMIKQMRVKFSGIDQGETSHSRDPKSPSQKTPSFKRADSKRGQNWYRRQSSREPTYDYDSDYMEGDEFRTAVAAAAFAVNSVEERRRRSARRKHSDLSRKPAERKQEDGAVNYAPRKARERVFSSSASNNKKMKNKKDDDDDTVPISTPASLLSRKSSAGAELQPQRAIDSPANKDEPFFKSTSFDKESLDKRKPENSRDSSIQNQPTMEVHRKRPQQRPEDIKADVWEKTEMERLKERYEKLNAKILEWETEKKEKAKKKLSRKQAKTPKKRDRALQEYKSDMEMIDQIAKGAKAQAEENQRKEAIKVMKKAETIRLTGKIPTKTCLCF